MADLDREYVEFVGAASASLRRTAFLVCGDRYKADDIVQEALTKLYSSWPKVRRVENPLSYVRRMVVNAAYDRGRQLSRREVSVAEVPDSADRHDFAAGHADRDEVLEALRGLAPRQRACLVLRYYEGLTVEQTAEILGCSEGTVKSQASRGLDTLRQAIDRARRTSRAL